MLKEFDKDLPRGVESTIMYNSKDFLDASIDQVLHTLVEAFILVFIVVFIFLQDFRSTLIPAIAVPVAIIGTFFFLQLFGYTINLLTLFAPFACLIEFRQRALDHLDLAHAHFGRMTAQRAGRGWPINEEAFGALADWNV